MTIQYVPIHVPKELRERIQQDKGTDTYDVYLKSLMKLREAKVSV